MILTIRSRAIPVAAPHPCPNRAVPVGRKLVFTCSGLVVRYRFAPCRLPVESNFANFR
jgi:hypothetical protein